MTARPILACVLTWSATTARADGALQELSVGSSPATSTSPSSSWIADRIAGMWDATSNVQLRVELGATRAYQAGVAADSHDVLLASLSVDYALGTHWSLHASASWSPDTNATATAALPTGMSVDGIAAVEAQLATISSLASGALSIGYQAAGHGNFETSVDASIGTTYYSLFQQLTSVDDLAGHTLSASTLQTYCAASSCDPTLMGALDPQWTHLAQYVVDASIVETVRNDTDLGMSAAYYLYDQDPTQAGYFSAASEGRANFGAGIGIAPVQYTLSPMLIHRWGGWTGTVAVAYSNYLDGQGYDASASLKLQYKLRIDATSRLKAYAKLATAVDVDAQSDVRTSGTVAMGVQYAW